MRTITVAKAEPTGKPIEDVCIEISGSVPPLNGDARKETALAFYRDQGRTIVGILFKHLPGGVVDQIIGEMLQRRAAMFRVAF